MMAKSNMNQDILKVLLSEEQLHQRIQEMGDELFEKFRDKDPMFVGVLNGCFVFMADLVRAAQLKSEVEFISVSSLLTPPLEYRASCFPSKRICTPTHGTAHFPPG